MTVEIHPDAQVSNLADIEDSIRGSIIRIGPHSVVDSFVKIKPAGGNGDLIIGANCQINSGCVIYTGNGIHIGNGVLIAANTTLAAANHEFSRRDIPIYQQGHSSERNGIVVEDDVWIGANCVLLDGTHIEAGAIVAAGSVVRGNLPGFGIFAGTPATQIGIRSK